MYIGIYFVHRMYDQEPYDGRLSSTVLRADKCEIPFGWLDFQFLPRGAESSALFYSLIETAKINGLEPYKYLKFLFEAFPKAKSSEELFNLLPMNIDNPKLKK